MSCVGPLPQLLSSPLFLLVEGCHTEEPLDPFFCPKAVAIPKLPEPSMAPLRSHAPKQYTKVLDLGHIELAFLPLHAQVVLAEALQDQASISIKLILCQAINQNVIQINHNAHANQVMKEIVQELLKHGQSVLARPKGITLNL